MAGSHRRDLPASRVLSGPRDRTGYQPTRRAERRPTTRSPLSAGLIAAPVALVATGAAVASGLVLGGPSSETSATSAHQAARPAGQQAGQQVTRTPAVSRSQSRASAADQAAATPASPVATHAAWASTVLNLYTGPGDRATPDGEISDGTQVAATDVTRNGRVQVLLDGVARWVTDDYLSTSKPVTAGLSDAPCPDGGVERGLAASTILLYRSVCHAFPQVTEYGGWAARSEHDTGHALDVMVYGDKALGDAIASWAREHAAELHLYDVLWYQRIWTPVRASEGWRPFADRGSATANHMDHVHLGTS